MMLTENELMQLTNAESETEWNGICDRVKAARGGQYPPDWYQKVIATGLVNRISGGLKIQKITF